jgi:hypothetical protein
MALAYAGALLNPLVRRIYCFRQFRIDQHALGQTSADAADDGTKNLRAHKS